MECGVQVSAAWFAAHAGDEMIARPVVVCAFVNVIVAGEDRVHSVSDEHRFELGAQI